MVLFKLEDVVGARAAFQRAHELGHGGAGQVLQFLDQKAGAVPGARASQDADVSDATAGPAMETAVKWAQLYVAACKTVLAAANACLKVANEAADARNMVARRPQNEISQIIASMAEEKDKEFAPLYRAFADACAKARDTAASFLAAQTGHDPETVLTLNVEEDVLTDLATVKAILGADYGFTPASFIEGVRQSTVLMQNPFPAGGNIYTPPPSAQPEERTCPWCAETIKAAAVICRFCGRDVQALPNTPTRN
jgi:hypothetical protein